MSDVAYYEQVGPDRYLPTAHVQGAWNDDEQHLSPVAGLLAHVVERHDPRPDLQLARIGYDVLGVIPLAETQVEVATVRPGRTVELVRATARAGGRDVVTATAWRLLRGDTAAVAGGGPQALPAPRAMPRWDGTGLWDGGYIASLEVRRAPDAAPGRAQVWVRSDVPLLSGGTTPTAAFLRLVDTANGVAVRQDPAAWTFPNVDLTVHLLREPVGPWVGFDTTVVFGTGGLGLTSSWLHDELGPVGRAEQALTVRPRPAR